MATRTTTTTRPGLSPADTNHKGGLGLSSTTHQRRPWLIGLGIALVVLCAAVAGSLFSSSAHRESVVVAAVDLPAGTVLSAHDLSTASIPTSTKISAMSAAGADVLIGAQINTPVVAGQVMVRQMISTTPQLAHGDQVVGMLVKGDQIPSVPLVAGDVVQVVAVPQTGQASSINAKGATGDIGAVLVATATVYAVGSPPANQAQYAASISVEVPSELAASVTAYAAADQIGLSLVSQGSR